MALTASFTNFNILMIDIAYLANGRHAVNGYVTQLAGGQTEQRISAFLCHELSGVARCAGQLPATAGIKLHIVDERTGRDISKRQCVAGLDIRVSARLNSIAGLQAAGARM